MQEHPERSGNREDPRGESYGSQPLDSFLDDSHHVEPRVKPYMPQEEKPADRYTWSGGRRDIELECI